MANPIAGNQNFTSVENITGQIRNLNVATGRVAELTAGTITSDSIVTDSITDALGLYRYTTVVAYAPTGFAGLAVSPAALTLRDTAAQADLTTYTSGNGMVIIPPLAEVLSIVAYNNGTAIAGGTTFNIGLSIALNTVPSTNLLAATLLASLNQAGPPTGVSAGIYQILADPSVVPQALGTAGNTLLLQRGLTIAAAASPTVTTLSVEAAAGGPNTTGDLRVIVRYREVV
jgi:hypothetical protein